MGGTVTLVRGVCGAICVRCVGVSWPFSPCFPGGGVGCFPIFAHVIPLTIPPLFVDIEISHAYYYCFIFSTDSMREGVVCGQPSKETG